MITEVALKEFKDIWLAEYGEEISDEEAMPKAVALLTLFDVIYRPIPEDWEKKYDDETDGTNLC
jgi:hypothetical protein